MPVLSRNPLSAPKIWSVRGTLDDLQSQTYDATGVTYSLMSQAEHDDFRAIFAALLAGNTALNGDLLALGFSAVPWLLPTGERLMVLREIAKRGAGCFVLRLDGWTGAPVSIQLNHRTDDLHTGPIGGDIFSRHRDFQAIGWNTVPRNNGSNPPWDMTDQPVAAVTAYAQAFATVHANGLFWQPHGFSAAARTTTRGQSAEIIIAAGQGNGVLPPAHITGFKTQATARGFTNLYRYNSTETGASDYVTELGATLNEQKNAMAALGAGRFLHTEMVRALRDTMLATQATRDNLAEAVIATV